MDYETGTYDVRVRKIRCDAGTRSFLRKVSDKMLTMESWLGTDVNTYRFGRVETDLIESISGSQQERLTELLMGQDCDDLGLQMAPFCDDWTPQQRTYALEALQYEAECLGDDYERKTGADGLPADEPATPLW